FSIEENGRILGSVFAHRQLEQANSPGILGLSTPETANWKALEHQHIDEAYATDFGKYYTDSTQNSFSMGSQTDFSADLYQIRGNLALDYAHYDQAISDLGKTLELNPYNPDAYFGRAKAHLAKGDYDQSLEDYREYAAQKPAPLARIVDFSIGFAKGLPKGAYESGNQLASFAYDLLAHPIDTGKEVCEAFTIMSKLVYTQEWETIGKALSPEIHQLITEWDNLSPQEQGEKAGYAFGKHGADLLLPGVIAKTASRAAAGGQEILAAYRTLNAAEKTLVLETVARSGASGEELLEIAGKITRGERSALFSNELSSLGNVEVIQLEKQVSGWLGEGAKFIRNEAGDPVFLSKDGLKCVRFDFNRTTPHNSPHAHIEVKVDGKWVKSGQIYPTDVPHN
ncbi:MAG TPA: hypothetical protein VIJ14_03845, partial [Rhabdochlamydiaceae bacterium]